MKKILAVCLAVLLLTVFGSLPAFAESEIAPDAQVTEEEQKRTEEVAQAKPEEVLLEAPDTEGFIVKKLPYGVTVVLEEDKPIRRAWTKNFTFNINHSWEDDSSYATTGFWFGNGITSYWITYSRDVHTEDPGRATFSFSWAF